MSRFKIPAAVVRLAAIAVAVLLVRRAEGESLKGLPAGQTDDLLHRLSSDRQMPAWARLLARAPWLYRRAPIDLVPDAIPFLGRIDDRLVTSVSLALLSRLAPREVLEAHVAAAQREAGAADA